MKMTDEREEMKILLDMAKAGDKEITELIATMYRPLILKMLKIHLQNWEDFDDAYQEGALVLLMAIRTYVPDKVPTFGLYLRSQLHYYYLKRKGGYYSEKSKKELSFDALMEEGFDFAEDTEAVSTETQDCRLFKAIATLAPKHKSALVDYYFKGRTQHAIAAAAGVSRTTVQKWLQRALDDLRKAYLELEQQ